ncbi:hypothetical protein AB5I41_17220 [Sphingomonas sp. MMS24-JH45]
MHRRRRLADDRGSVGVSDLEWNGRSIRNTLLILGALLARTGAASVPMPGGCDLGDRRRPTCTMVLTKLGAKVWYEGERLFAEAPNGLTGADIVLPLRSTGATENALIAGSLARGTTRLWNPHIRPEILDLARFLERMGAKITVYGRNRFEIAGATALDGISHRVMPDNMEAMTWLIGSVITGGDVEIHDFPAEDLEVPLIFLRESEGRACSATATWRSCVRAAPIRWKSPPAPIPASIPTCSRCSPRWARARAANRAIVDLRFAGRYAYLEEFAKMGVESEVRGDTAHIRGCDLLRGANVRALDLRAGAALAMLGLVADGTTRITEMRGRSSTATTNSLQKRRPLTPI